MSGLNRGYQTSNQRLSWYHTWCLSPENPYVLFEAQPPLGGLGGQHEDQVRTSIVNTNGLHRLVLSQHILVQLVERAATEPVAPPTMNHTIRA